MAARGTTVPTTLLLWGRLNFLNRSTSGSCAGASKIGHEICFRLLCRGSGAGRGCSNADAACAAWSEGYELTSAGDLEGKDDRTADLNRAEPVEPRGLWRFGTASNLKGARTVGGIVKERGVTLAAGTGDGVLIPGNGQSGEKGLEITGNFFRSVGFSDSL